MIDDTNQCTYSLAQLDVSVQYIKVCLFFRVLTLLTNQVMKPLRRGYRTADTCAKMWKSC